MCIQITTTPPCHHTELLAWQYSPSPLCDRTETKCPVRTYKIRKPYGANCGTCHAAEEGRKRESKEVDTKTKNVFTELRKMGKRDSRDRMWRPRRVGDGDGGVRRDGYPGADGAADSGAQTEVDWEKLGLKGLRFVGGGEGSQSQNQNQSWRKESVGDVQSQEKQVVKEMEKQKPREEEGAWRDVSYSRSKLVLKKRGER